MASKVPVKGAEEPREEKHHHIRITLSGTNPRALGKGLLSIRHFITLSISTLHYLVGFKFSLGGVGEARKG